MKPLSDKKKIIEELSKEVENYFADKSYSSLLELFANDKSEGYVRFNTKEYIKSILDYIIRAAHNDASLVSHINKLKNGIKNKNKDEIVLSLELINNWLLDHDNISKSEEIENISRSLFIFARIAILKLQTPAIKLLAPKEISPCLLNIEKNSKKLLKPANNIEYDFQEVYGDINKDNVNKDRFEKLEQQLSDIIELKELHEKLSDMLRNNNKNNLPRLLGFNPYDLNKIKLFDSVITKLENTDTKKYWDEYKLRHIEKSKTIQTRIDGLKNAINKPIKKKDKFEELLKAVSEQTKEKANNIADNNRSFADNIIASEIKDLATIKSKIKPISLISEAKKIMSSYINANDSIYMRFMIFIGKIPLFKTSKVKLFNYVLVAENLISKLSKLHDSVTLMSLLTEFNKTNLAAMEHKKTRIKDIKTIIETIKKLQPPESDNLSVSMQNKR